MNMLHRGTATACLAIALSLTGCSAGTTTTGQPRGTTFEQAAAKEQVVSDARNLIAALTTHHGETSSYPATSTDAVKVGASLSEGNRIASYANHANTNVIVCVANDTYGAWARFDATNGLLASGAGATAGEITEHCASAAN